MDEEKPSEPPAESQGTDSSKNDVAIVNTSNLEARTEDSLDPNASNDQSLAVERPAATEPIEAKTKEDHPTDLVVLPIDTESKNDQQTDLVVLSVDTKAKEDQPKDLVVSPIDATPEEDHPTDLEILPIDTTPKEDHLIDLVVLDDGDSSPSPNDVHQQPRHQSKSDPNDHQLTLQVVKSDSLSIANHSTDPPGPGLVLGALNSLTTEPFVLQLAPSDALDSDLDTAVEQPAGESSKNDAPNGGADTGDMKENGSNQANVPASKVAESEKVCDSLILCADDELETEMLTDKNDKASDEGKGVGGAKRDVSGAGVGRRSEAADAPGEDVKKNGVSCEKGAAKSITSDKKTAIKSDNKQQLAAQPSKILWVSNITHSVKATDLKQYISKTGKVTTAKVVTDGKKCYGYVVMANSDTASKCLKLLNNANFEGRKISVSFTRPLKTDLKKDVVAKSHIDKPKSVKDSENETDEAKATKTTEPSKRRRSPHADRTKRLSKLPPGRTRSSSRRSRSSDHTERLYQREKLAKERLQRQLVEEQRRNREELHRQMQREEKQRDMEFKLEQERRKLQLERELFEKERREMTRLDCERRIIERERLELLQQRTKLETDLQKTRMTLSSVITKPPGMKPYEKREVLKDGYRKPRFQKDDHKIGDGKVVHRSVPKQDRSPKDRRSDSKGSKRGGDDFKSYDRSTAPPPPKLSSNEFGFPPGRKTRLPERKSDYVVGPYGEKKTERGGRKNQTVEGKFYPLNQEGGERRDRTYRNPDFEQRKPHVFSERKYEYGRDGKRYRDEGYPQRDTAQRAQWATPATYNDSWKSTPSAPAGGSSTTRYQEQNFSSSTQAFGGSSRVQQFYYPPPASSQEYPRYDNTQQAHGRKY